MYNRGKSCSGEDNLTVTIVIEEQKMKYDTVYTLGKHGAVSSPSLSSSFSLSTTRYTFYWYLMNILKKSFRRRIDHFGLKNTGDSVNSSGQNNYPCV